MKLGKFVVARQFINKCVQNELADSVSNGILDTFSACFQSFLDSICGSYSYLCCLQELLCNSFNPLCTVRGKVPVHSLKDGWVEARAGEVGVLRNAIVVTFGNNI